MNTETEPRSGKKSTFRIQLPARQTSDPADARIMTLIDYISHFQGRRLLFRAEGAARLSAETGWHGRSLREDGNLEIDVPTRKI